MKSYAAQPFDLLQRALPIVERGASTVTVVDSAGGMLPNQVSAYIEVLAAGLDARIGFHGHNNLLLANANSLAAVQAGASIIDATLLGMGRGGGNAQTETMLVILEKAGYGTGINPLQVAKRADRSRSIFPSSFTRTGTEGVMLLAEHLATLRDRLDEIAALAARTNKATV